jgi:serine phosphatase RsbU (regulator of sigma subunit)
MLVAYTDGVSDARSARGVEFGTQRLVDAAQVHLGQPAQAVLNGVLTTLEEFTGHVPPADDMTLLVAVRT